MTAWEFASSHRSFRLCVFLSLEARFESKRRPVIGARRKSHFLLSPSLRARMEEDRAHTSVAGDGPTGRTVLAHSLVPLQVRRVFRGRQRKKGASFLLRKCAQPVRVCEHTGASSNLSESHRKKEKKKNVFVVDM